MNVPTSAVGGGQRDPVPMLLWCPACHARHVDLGEFATKPHHTHACQRCGLAWRPAVVPTVGVQFLPGFKDPPTLASRSVPPADDLVEGRPQSARQVPYGQRCTVSDPGQLWTLTASGRRFYPAAPAAGDIDILDIAHGLSLLCRFGGHIRSFYSVAEHSVRVARALAAAGFPAYQFEGLMHDAAEAYLGDVIWPLKQLLPDYKALERGVEAAVAARFGLPAAMSDTVKRFDLVLLSTEKRDLTAGAAGHDVSKEALAHDARWHSDDFAPLPGKIEPWSTEYARAAFLTLFDRLCRPEDRTPERSYVATGEIHQSYEWILVVTRPLGIRFSGGPSERARSECFVTEPVTFRHVRFVLRGGGDGWTPDQLTAFARCHRLRLTLGNHTHLLSERLCDLLTLRELGAPHFIVPGVPMAMDLVPEDDSLGMADRARDYLEDNPPPSHATIAFTVQVEP